jgi:hypothetical protein
VINNQHKLYVDNVLNLAETIVIKLSDAAEAMNNQVRIDSGLDSVDINDERSWKYYQNISGQYHLTDAPILVDSLDSTESIVFTIANLELHAATKLAYQFGTRYYRELILRYPDKELLILGVLYPCDIDAAIAAKDGTILGYPKNLVEVNEYSFIPKLQKWIYNYLFRWVNKQYTLSDDLYSATYIGQLFLHLVPAIFNIRLEACKTNEAHSFHVQQYLASNGFLDSFLSTMTNYQALFFYRNILYIQRNAGKKDTFDWLVQNIMTHRRLPFYEYSMNHDVSAMGRDQTDLFETPLQGETSLETKARLNKRSLPQVIFRRKAVNDLAKNIQKIEYPLQTILNKIEPLALGNKLYQDEHAQNISDALAYSPSSVVATKVLESSIIDYSDSEVYTLVDILFNNWIYFAAKGLYTATSVLNLPKSGTSVRLEAQEAVALFVYLTMKAYEPAVIPVNYPTILKIMPLRVNRALNISPTLTINTLRQNTLTKYLSDIELKEIFDTRVVAPPMLSINSFLLKCEEILFTAKEQFNIYASKENMHGRAHAKAAVSKLYTDETVRLNTLSGATAPFTGQLYSLFLNNKGLDFTGYNSADFNALAVDLVSVATGANTLKDSALAAIQASMVKLFTQLSSYSIQVISEINTSKIISVGSPQVRIGDAPITQSYHEYVLGADERALGAEFTDEQNFFMDLDVVFPPHGVKTIETFNDIVDISVHTSVLREFGGTDTNHVYVGVDVHSSFDFDNDFSLFTDLQKNQLVDIYCASGENLTSTEIFLIGGFTYVSDRKEIPVFQYNDTLDAGLAIFKPIETRTIIAGFNYVGNRAGVEAHLIPNIQINYTLSGFNYLGLTSQSLNGFL